MRDQAEKLRQLVKAGSESSLATAKRRNQVIAVTSGKGGVGKTNLAVNLGIALCELGLRVALMDADLGLANVDVLLGILPEYSLKDVLDGVELSRILCTAPGGLQVIPGGSGVQELANLDEGQLEKFINALQEVECLFDVILIDTGAGISRSVTSFLYAADRVLLVTTPEPTSITDAYAVVKTMLKQASQAQLSLVVNRAADMGEARETHRKLNAAVHNFLGSELNFSGWIVDDPLVPRAVRAHQPLMLFAPNSSVSRLFRQLAKTIANEGLAGGNVATGSRAPAAGGLVAFASKLKNVFRFGIRGG